MVNVIWIAFFLLVCFLVLLDLGILGRKEKAPKIGEALIWSSFWIALALLFNVAVYFIYEYGDIADSWFLIPKPGKQAALEFFTGYLLEKSLSLDNIFVISLIFSYYRIEARHQHRVLVIGILTAAILRGLLIFLGVALVSSFSWVLYIFGFFLAVTGLKLLFSGERAEVLPGDNFVVRIVGYLIPVSTDSRKGSFFIRENGVLMITPLFLALVQIETADVVFAVDSIPAIFAVTLDPFIVYTSNIFAIFGLRALYFSLAPLVRQFHWVKKALALILLFIGIKMLGAHYYKIDNLVSLLFIIAVLGGAIALSLVRKKA